MNRKPSLFIFAAVAVAMIACYFGVYFADLATRHVENDLLRLMFGIAIGLLVGILVGLFIKWLQKGIKALGLRG